MFKTSLTILLLISSNAMAEITVSTSKNNDNTTVHASHETLASVLKFYYRHYNTTSTLPASMADDKIDADAKGSSLMTATLRLLHAYNIGLVAGKENGLSHISILPSGEEVENNSMMEVGKSTPEAAQRYKQMIQRTRQAWRSRSPGNQNKPSQPSQEKRFSNWQHNSWGHKHHAELNRHRQVRHQ